MTTRRLCALLLALCLLAVPGCTSETAADPEPEVTPTPTQTPVPTPFSLPYYPEASLHPITGDNRTNLVICSLVYDGLFALDNTFTPHNVLCSQAAVSEDGLTWTFTLASRTFSDGTPVTAADVAASLELARTSTLYAARLAGVSSVSAGEDGTVIVTLSDPNTQLPALLDIPIVREVEGSSQPLGTGPYTFSGGASPKLVRCANAPDSAPAEIPLVAIAGADDLIYSFDAGEVSLVVSDLTGANALGYSTGYESFDYPTTTMLYVGLRTSGGTCSDELVRQALSRAFDRDTVTVSLLAGHADTAALPVSPSSALYDTALAQAAGYSPSAAAALLEQTGYQKGEDGLLYRGRTALELTFVVNTDNSFKLAVAEYLAGQLSSLGITVDLQKLSWDDYLTALERGNFDLYLGEVSLTADFDLSSLVGSGGTLNYGGYSSTQTQALLSALRIADDETRLEAAQALYTQLQEDVPLVPLCFKTGSVLTQWGSVSGLTPTRQNPFYNLENLRFSAS